MLAWGACTSWFLLLLTLAIAVDSWWIWSLVVLAGYIPISILIKGTWYETIREWRKMFTNRSSRNHQLKKIELMKRATELAIFFTAAFAFVIATGSIIEDIKASDDSIEIVFLTAFVAFGTGSMIIMVLMRAFGQKWANLAGLAAVVIIPIAVAISKLT